MIELYDLQTCFVSVTVAMRACYLIAEMSTFVSGSTQYKGGSITANVTKANDLFVL